MEPFEKDMTRGQLCAFLVGYPAFLPETQVVVKSILHFMPGMRIAIATSSADVSVFERCCRGRVGGRVVGCASFFRRSAGVGVEGGGLASLDLLFLVVACMLGGA